MSQAVKHWSRRHLLVAVITMLLAGIILLVGCNSAPTIPPPSIQTPPAVPEKADLLGKVELAQIIGDEDFAELYAEIAAQNTILPQTLDEALDKLENETGVDLNCFTNVTVFANVSTLAESMGYLEGSGLPYYGALVEGDIDESSIIHSMEQKTGQQFETSDYQGYTIYTAVISDSGNRTPSITFLDGQLVIGTSQAVEDVIDVVVGSQNPISGSVFDWYSQLGDAVIKIACRVPEPLTGKIPEEVPVGPMNLTLRSFRDINYATFTITKDETTVTATVDLIFTNTDSAKDSKGLLSTAITAGKYAVPDPDAREVLSKVHISGSGSSVSLTLAMTMSEIEHLASLMSTMFTAPEEQVPPENTSLPE